MSARVTTAGTTHSRDIDVPIPGLPGWRVRHVTVVDAEVHLTIASPDRWERTSGLSEDFLEALKRAIRDDYDYGGGVEAYKNVDPPADALLRPTAAYLVALITAEIAAKGEPSRDEPLFQLAVPEAEVVSLAAARARKGPQ